MAGSCGINGCLCDLDDFDARQCGCDNVVDVSGATSDRDYSLFYFWRASDRGYRYRIFNGLNGCLSGHTLRGAAKGWLELTAVYRLFCRTAQAAGQILSEFVIFTFKPA